MPVVTQIRRYAILLPNGLYSHGPDGKGVLLPKAKLWKQIGHVKTHLLGMPKNAYPTGTMVVELILTESGNAWALDDLLEQNKLRKEERDAENLVRWTEYELRQAQKVQPNVGKLQKKLEKAKEKLQAAKTNRKKK